MSVFHRRRGFTLVELLVVIAIIAMLVLLLLPAVNAAREAARRNNCANAVRQLALGALNRESATTRFPNAMWGAQAADKIDSRNAEVTTETDGYSWVVALLPFIEETALYDQLQELTEQFTEPITTDKLEIRGTRGSYVQERPVELLLCPSFPGENLAQGRLRHKGFDQIQVSNYIALVAGCVEGTRQVYNDAVPTTGGMIVTKQASPKGMKIGECKDGTSKVAFIGESKAELWSVWFTGRGTTAVATPPDLVTCNKILRNKDPQDGFPAPRPDIPSALNFGRRFDAPRDNKDPNYNEKFQPKPRDWGPSSAHSGEIVNHAYVDGHVKGISAGTDPKVYFRLVTRAGGEPVDES